MSHVNPLLVLLIFAVPLATVPPGANCALAQNPVDAESTQDDDPRFARLQHALTGATLVGHFTMTGQGDDAKLSAERYELESVRHVGDDRWQFVARIKYGEHDVKLPLTLPVYWAGDTPVISIDTMPIPGLGTYTARVMIYADHYAGFWSGGDHGGHLFGVVQRKDDKKDGQRPSAD